MSIALPPLPFARDALEPHMSAATLDFHHGKHHKAYVDKTNAKIKGTALAGKPLEDIVRAAKAQGDDELFNNSAQAWNHDFLWRSLSPNGGKSPTGKLKAKLDSAFGGLEGFQETFSKTAAEHFGSGWTWLCQKGDGLAIIATHDADTPIVHNGLRPLLTLDVWEHAYYLDYQNERPDYIDSFLKNTANWAFAAANLS